MKNELLLSVVVPVYNDAPWLIRCLNSILAQTYHNLEIIVIDDGSTDESSQIIDDYAHKYDQIIAIHQKNQGLVAARECGISNAHGDFIGFVDGDDEIIPEMYEKLMYNAQFYNAQISQCGILCVYHDGTVQPIHGTGIIRVYNRKDGNIALLEGKEFEPSLCNKIYSASILANSCLDQSIVNNEDMLRNIVLFNRANQSVLEDFCGYVYKRRKESMSFHKNSEEIVRNILKARKLILDYVSVDLKAAAIENYTQGAMRCYNILLPIKTRVADNLRSECRMILRQYGFLINKKFSVDFIRIIMIIYLPFLYGIIEKIHINVKRK